MKSGRSALLKLCVIICLFIPFVLTNVVTSLVCTVYDYVQRKLEEKFGEGGPCMLNAAVNALFFVPRNIGAYVHHSFEILLDSCGDSLANVAYTEAEYVAYQKGSQHSPCSRITKGQLNALPTNVWQDAIQVNVSSGGKANEKVSLPPILHSKVDSSAESRERKRKENKTAKRKATARSSCVKEQDQERQSEKFREVRKIKRKDEKDPAPESVAKKRRVGTCAEMFPMVTDRGDFLSTEVSQCDPSAQMELMEISFDELADSKRPLPFTAGMPLIKEQQVSAPAERDMSNTINELTAAMEQLQLVPDDFYLADGSDMSNKIHELTAAMKQLHLARDESYLADGSDMSNTIHELTVAMGQLHLALDDSYLDDGSDCDSDYGYDVGYGDLGLGEQVLLIMGLLA